MQAPSPPAPDELAATPPVVVEVAVLPPTPVEVALPPPAAPLVVELAGLESPPQPAA
jgi:hypothetical protein